MPNKDYINREIFSVNYPQKREE